MEKKASFVDDPIDKPGQSRHKFGKELKRLSFDDDIVEAFPEEDVASIHSRKTISPTRVGKDIVRFRQMPLNFYRKHRQLFDIIFKVVLVLAVFAYLSVALIKNFQKAKQLLIITVIILSYKLYQFLCERGLKDKINKYYIIVKQYILPYKMIVRIVMYVVVTLAMLIFIIVDSKGKLYTTISASGLLVFIFISFIFSKDPSRIPWATVYWGIIFQIILGVIILRWTVGHDVFLYIGTKINDFLAFTDVGSKFVFDQNYYICHFFAFKIMPVLIFVSFCISILYYYNIVQHFILITGTAMRWLLGTSLCESTNAVANVFFGMLESPLIIAPYVATATNSELHCIMTSGFATITGPLLLIYRTFGIDPNHLLAASILSAPASLVISKLMYPEIQIRLFDEEILDFDKSPYVNVLEAVCEGTAQGLTLIVNVVSNVIAILAFIQFVDTLFEWLCFLIGYENVTLEWIGAWLFWPIALIMGVTWDDAFLVAELIATKTLFNEFVAYIRLSELIKQGRLTTHRSAVIAIYALCGFSNISSLGTQLGSLGGLAPSRKGDISELVFRALISGSISCFMTACIAGLLVQDEAYILEGTSEPPIIDSNVTIAPHRRLWFDITIF